MPSINSIANFTGFSRDSLTRRQQLFELGASPSCKNLLQLIPIDETHAQKISLEEARTQLAIEETRLKKMLADEKEQTLAPTDDLLERFSVGWEIVSQQIRKSSMTEEEKQASFDAIRDQLQEYFSSVSKCAQ